MTKQERQELDAERAKREQAIGLALIDLAHAAVNVQNGNQWEAIAFINRATVRLEGGELK